MSAHSKLWIKDSDPSEHIFAFSLFSTFTCKAQMELETTGRDQIISPGTLVWAPHHLRPQVTSVTCAELRHMPLLLCPGRDMWGKLAGAGSITSCWTVGRCSAICKLRYSWNRQYAAYANEYAVTTSCSWCAIKTWWTWLWKTGMWCKMQEFHQHWDKQ